MLKDLKLKKCVINDGEFEFQYSRFGEQLLVGKDYGDNLKGYDLLLTVDTDLSPNNNYIIDMSELKNITINKIDFYDVDNTTIITSLTNYKVIDMFTDLVTYQDETNYRGSIRFVKNI